MPILATTGNREIKGRQLLASDSEMTINSKIRCRVFHLSDLAASPTNPTTSNKPNSKSATSDASRAHRLTGFESDQSVPISPYDLAVVVIMVLQAPAVAFFFALGEGRGGDCDKDNSGDVNGSPVACSTMDPASWLRSIRFEYLGLIMLPHFRNATRRSGTKLYGA